MALLAWRAEKVMMMIPPPPGSGAGYQVPAKAAEPFVVTDVALS